MVNQAIETKGNNSLLNLRDYYKNLPDRISPKQTFLRTLAKRCGVSEVTVRKWISGERVPADPEYFNIINEITSIPSIEYSEERSMA